MNETELRGLIRRLILTELARQGELYAPVLSSNRHCHLSPADVEKLFGPGSRLTQMRPLGQPGQFACNEKVTLVTPKGEMTLRVVGPERKETQVELSFTDCAKLGLRPPIRMSGDLEGSPGCVLKTPKGSVTLSRGVIIAERHLHISPEEAEVYGLKNGDRIALQIEGPRPGVLEQVIVRCGKGHVLEAHIDKDEANACALADGTPCRILLPGEAQKRAPAAPAAKTQDRTGEKGLLITEDDIREAAEQGIRRILCPADALITPLAADLAREKDVELIRPEEKERG